MQIPKQRIKQNNRLCKIKNKRLWVMEKGYARLWKKQGDAKVMEKKITKIKCKRNKKT